MVKVSYLLMKVFNLYRYLLLLSNKKTKLYQYRDLKCKAGIWVKNNTAIKTINVHCHDSSAVYIDK